MATKKKYDFTTAPSWGVSRRRHQLRGELSIWCALYTTVKPRSDGGRCWNIQFGTRGGPKFSYDVAEKLARRLLRTNRKLKSLFYVMPGTPKSNGWV